MICSLCRSATVRWMGPISNLTHTECEHCGAVNSQVLDEEDDPEEEHEFEEYEE